MAGSQPYVDNGILISKNTLSSGDEIEVIYKGLLAENGADQVFLHGGYGDEWDEKFFVSMERGNEAEFRTMLKLSKLSGELHITFKDSADNWDNNSSENYSFKIKKAKAPTTPTTKSTKSVSEKATQIEKPKKTRTVKKTATSRQKTAKNN